MRRTVSADSPDARPEFANRQVGRKLNTVITAVLMLAVALLGWRLLALRHAGSASEPKAIAAAQVSNPAAAHVISSTQRESTAPTQSATFNPPADTLVVLPFANLGGDPEQQYSATASPKNSPMRSARTPACA